MSYEKTLDAFKQLYEDIDKDNWLFVGTINPDMIQVAIDAIKSVIECKSISKVFTINPNDCGVIGGWIINENGQKVETE